MPFIWIGVERNHTVVLLYVYVFILSTVVFHFFGSAMDLGNKCRPENPNRFVRGGIVP